MQEKSEKKSLRVVIILYFRLLVRVILFVWAITICITDSSFIAMSFDEGLKKYFIMFIFIWTFFVGEMIIRLFPSDRESMGCQKIFKCNYNESGETLKKEKMLKKLINIIIIWFLINGVIVGYHYRNYISDIGMILFFLFYSILDVSCTLFFCPLREFIMGNRCCVTCRIYEWGYLGTTVPLFFVANVWTYIVILVAFIHFVRWEIVIKLHPERISESTNLNLRCVNCKEKLCQYRKFIEKRLKKNSKERNIIINS